MNSRNGSIDVDKEELREIILIRKIACDWGS